MDSGIDDTDNELEFENNKNKTKLQNKKKTFCCTFLGCSEAYTRFIHLQNHFNYVHLNQKCFKCTFEGCNKSYSSGPHLKRHQQTHESNTIEHKCKLCFTKINTLTNLKRHYNRVHNRKEELHCKECDKTFKKKHHYKNHMKLVKHDLNQIPENNECSIKSPTKIVQTDTTTNDKEIKQEIEPTLQNALEFQSENQIEGEQLQLKKKTYKCDFPGCEKIFYKLLRLKNHNNVHFNERPYKCTFEGCTKRYTNGSHLKRHREIHEMVTKTYICNICSASISTKSNLKRHYNRAHDTEGKLYCKECNLKFRKKNRYEEHVAAHANSSLYTCNVCEKNFSTHSKFNRHKEIHNSTKEYKCSVDNCTEVFNKWALMVKHRITKHVIEYSCDKCSKVFKSKSNLKTHSEIHNKTRPVIPCPYDECNRLYYFQRNLNTHIRIKHTNKKFECDVCNTKLSTKQKIAYHIKSKHLTQKRVFKRKQPRVRKDIGIPKKSAVSELTGIYLTAAIEKILINRNSSALLRDKNVEDISYSEDERTSDVRSKGA